MCTFPFILAEISFWGLDRHSNFTTHLQRHFIAAMNIILIVFCLILARCSGRHHDRLHPGLKFCDANPLVAKLNKTRIMELEKNEWYQWDLTVLQRTMKMARSFAKGNDYYLKQEFKTTVDFTSKPCDIIVGNIEAMNYIAYPLESLLPCPSPVKMYGATVDSGKFVCEAGHQLNVDNCVVFSLGSNNRFDFEEGISKEFKRCKIYTFDCTSQPPPTPIDNVVFEQTCLGARDEVIDGRQYHTIEYLMKQHGMQAIQLFKMDIEGYEMEVFDALLTPPYPAYLPYQLLFETHWWQMSAVTGLFHMALFQQLTLAGYRPVDRANNRECTSCNEHTFVRVYC